MVEVIQPFLWFPLALQTKGHVALLASAFWTLEMAGVMKQLFDSSPH